jgi:hypothetical protein
MKYGVNGESAIRFSPRLGDRPRVKTCSVLIESEPGFSLLF